jgi:hypothetical protein
MSGPSAEKLLKGAILKIFGWRLEIEIYSGFRMSRSL